jgi:preprotein translocase subunit SecG
VYKPDDFQFSLQSGNRAMTTVVLVIHLMIAAALVAVVLLQRSEGGALGMGGGGSGGFLTGRGTSNLLTRATAVLAGCFFVTSVVLSILAQRSVAPRSVFEPTADPATKSAPPTPAEAPKTPETGKGGVLDALQKGQGQAPLPTVPQTR